MRFPHAAGVALLSVAMGLVAFAAVATPRTVYDPATPLLYDLRSGQVAPGRAFGAAHAPPRWRRPSIRSRTRNSTARSSTTTRPEAPGTVIVDTKDKFLYYVLEDGQAIRMGVGVGREGFGWTGTVHVGNKQENPKWFPPSDMVGGSLNSRSIRSTACPAATAIPLGVRAIYLYDDKGKDTLYRIHGTIEPNSIGLNVSSGCIRMLNENVTELYDLVKIGTKVVVM